MTHDHRTMISGPMPCHCAIFRIAEHGAFLAMRHTAAEIRNAVEEDLYNGFTVVLDFEGVQAITGAFADELVAKLRADHGDRVRYEGANAEVEETIQTAISRRTTPTPRS